MNVYVNGYAFHVEYIAVDNTCTLSDRLNLSSADRLPCISGAGKIFP